MIIWIAVIAILIALIYFLTQRRRHDEVWRRFRQRRQERLSHPPSEQPIDPTFQFDRPSADVEKDKR
jgi:hypothetical protein